MIGPTDYSNWIIKNKVIVGRYPGGCYYHFNPDTMPEITKIVECGVTTFISLVGEETFDEYIGDYPHTLAELE